MAVPNVAHAAALAPDRPSYSRSVGQLVRHLRKRDIRDMRDTDHGGLGLSGAPPKLGDVFVRCAPLQSNRYRPIGDRGGQLADAGDHLRPVNVETVDATFAAIEPDTRHGGAFPIAGIQDAAHAFVPLSLAAVAEDGVGLIDQQRRSGILAEQGVDDGFRRPEPALNSASDPR